MAFSSLCAALYPKKAPYSSKPKFVFAIFHAAGGPVTFDDSYGRKLFNGEKPFSDSLRVQFPENIDRASLHKLFDDILKLHGIKAGNDGNKLQRLAQDAGIRTSLTVERPVLIDALIDWFDEIVHQRTGLDTLEAHYIQRLETGLNNPLPLPTKPLYASDRVDVIHPPATQNYKVDWYETFEHTWTLKNSGAVGWKGRYLKCLNPKGSIRPLADFFAVPDCEPSTSDLIVLKTAFKARGQEGYAASHWRMFDKNGEDCFPGDSSSFDVAATVTNPNVSRRRGGNDRQH